MKTRRIHCWLNVAIFSSAAAPMAHPAPGETHDGPSASAVRIQVTPSSFDGPSGLQELTKHVGTAGIVFLLASDRGDANIAARSRMIHLLHRELAFEVLVLPVGIFEGAMLGRRLAGDVPISTAAETLYRVWRESEPFQTLLKFCRSTHSMPRPLRTAGYKCRFHATAKALYPEHLIAFFDHVDAGLLSPETKTLIQTVLGTRERLSRADAAKRAAAKSLSDKLIDKLDDESVRLSAAYSDRQVAFERKVLENMRRFVELEDHRAHGSVPKSFIETEAADNLVWFAEVYFVGKKLIIWRGAD